MTTFDRFARWLGVLGSLLVVLGGLYAGVGPAADTRQIPHHATAAILWPTAVVYLGMTLILIAWWTIGRSLPEPGALIRTGLLWAAPFVLSGPIFSRDVYSYLAQGAMTVAGLDPYRFGPAALGGELAVNVPPIWQDTPAPYGPVFLRLAGGVTSMTGEQLWPGLIGMRLLAFAGIALIAVTLPGIARACGVSPSAALWLGVLNPLVLLHLVADAHNEAVMIGLMCAGLLLALRHRPLAGAVLITLAGLVKGPALAGLAFLAVLWAGRLTGRCRWARAIGGTLLAAVGAAVTVTALTGTGFGWIPALRTPTLARTWMSLTTDAGTLLGALGIADASAARQALGFCGLATAAVIALVLLRRGRGPGLVAALGLFLVALVLLSPVVHAWYLLWGIVPLAAAGSERARRWTVWATPVLVVVAPPNDVPPGLAMVLGAVLGVATGLLLYGLLRAAHARSAVLAAPQLLTGKS